MARIKIVNFLVICMFVFLGLGLINLEVIQGQKFKDLSNKNCIRLLPQEGARGKILDRNGNIIVDNKLSYDVMILPQGLNEWDKTLNAVSSILGISSRDLKDVFKSSFVASSLPVVIAKKIDVKKAIALQELKQDLPGIIIQPRPQRQYPYANLAAHILGYVSEIDHWRLTKLADYGYKTKDIVGFGGIEEKYDYYLRQEEGGLSIEVDYQGRLVRTVGFKPPSNGKDIQLTLDLKLQKIAQQQLADKKGCVIIMDPYTGAVLAMASFPDFAPSAFVDKTGAYILSLLNNPDATLVNRAISASFPPGSIFKLIVATAGLQTGKLNLSRSFMCTGNTFIGRREFVCWDTHGPQNLIAAIAHSCNVFFYKAGLLLGPQIIHDYALKFGLSRPTSFELPYEAAGFIPSPLWRKINKFSRHGGIPFFAGKNWFEGDTANLSIGQGDVLVTPLQMARVMAVFANSGYAVTPYIVKAIAGRDISNYQKKITNLGLKTTTIDYIRQGLREVVLDPKGTGNVLADLAISIAGKTGSAQVPGGQAHAWFIGFFPFKEPKFVICVFLERGGPGYLSCVLAKQIIEAMINEGLI